MKPKTCKRCGKEMKFEDYAYFKSYSEKVFARRKYCKDCSKIVNLEQIKSKNKRKEWDLTKEHHKRIVEVNKLINGEIVGINSSIHGKTPDIIKGNSIYEVEILGNDSTRKFKSKCGNDKKKVLIICIRNGLKDLFDEVYLFEKDNLIKIK